MISCKISYLVSTLLVVQKMGSTTGTIKNNRTISSWNADSSCFEQIVLITCVENKWKFDSVWVRTDYVHTIVSMKKPKEQEF